jgi:endonuclease/exonuclease/phosphatase family metal-dependent hydrolase
MPLKQLLSLKTVSIFFLLLGALFLVYQTNKSNLTSERKTVNTRAADTQVRVMTYNIHFSNEDIRQKGEAATVNELKALAQYIKNNQIDVVALQELMRLSDEDNDDVFEDLKIINAELNAIGYPMKTVKRRTFKNDEASKREEYFRAFLYRDNAAYTQLGYDELGDAAPGKPEGSGNDVLTLQTPLGKMIFVNHHPMPENARVGSQKLIEYITPFKNDGAPLILMGDFNMRFYFIPPVNQADYKPYVDALYNAGFKSACDPEKFPDNNCKDTVTSTDPNDGYAIDQILVDTRASFFVQKAYVDHVRTDSDHLPVIAIFTSLPPATPTSATLPNPTGLTHTCNANGTVTFRWNAVSRAGEYGVRLDEQGTNPNSPIRDWYSPPIDAFTKTYHTSTSMTITYGRYYQGAVTAVVTPGSSHPLPAWQPAFKCVAPTSTRMPTPTRRPTATPTRKLTPTLTKTPTLNCAKKASGDANCDGIVNTMDYTCWRFRLLTGNELAHCQNADFNGKENVNILDFAIWKNTYLRQ